mmetsp:Transcript_16265/g.13902  ORF Transcript_16265/g.13902 Transcript_16265/m.13902 type:complete len:240 (-) Transcript_16265:773-1492(-)
MLRNFCKKPSSSLKSICLEQLLRLPLISEISLREFSEEVEVTPVVVAIQAVAAMLAATPVVVAMLEVTLVVVAMLAVVHRALETVKIPLQVVDMTVQLHKTHLTPLIALNLLPNPQASHNLQANHSLQANPNPQVSHNLQASHSLQANPNLLVNPNLQVSHNLLVNHSHQVNPNLPSKLAALNSHHNQAAAPKLSPAHNLKALQLKPPNQTHPSPSLIFTLIPFTLTVLKIPKCLIPIS